VSVSPDPLCSVAAAADMRGCGSQTLLVEQAVTSRHARKAGGLV